MQQVMKSKTKAWLLERKIKTDPKANQMRRDRVKPETKEGDIIAWL